MNGSCRPSLLGRRLIPLVLLATAALAAPFPSAATAATRTLLTAPAAVPSQVTPTFFDTTRRAAVRDAFFSNFAPEVPDPAWTGDVDQCQPGTTSAGFRTRVLGHVNYYRRMAGVTDQVTEDPELSRLAQASALISSASGELSHQPDNTFDCFSQAGLDGSSRSNLLLGLSGPEAMLGYMLDDGGNNAATGHRSWILQPNQRRMGTDDVEREDVDPANSLFVIDPGTNFSADAPTRNPNGFVMWPNPGAFVDELVAERWTLQAIDADFGGATVTVTEDGRPVASPVEYRGPSGGMPTLTFLPDLELSESTDHNVSVQVSGIQPRSGSGATVPASLSWATTVVTAPELSHEPVQTMVRTPNGGGYWLVASDGAVYPFGNAGSFGSTDEIRLNQPIVGMAATASGNGYWLVASDGGIFPFGDAVGHGSTGGIRLNQPIVGMAATQSGNGYWLVARDGGIFPFGDAVGHGSTGGIRLNQPIVGMAPSSNGYWLVARDGGIFPFGNAVGHGSTGNIQLNEPIVGMAPSSNGYWLVARDGGIFPFGNAVGHGSLGSVRLNQPIANMSATPNGDGYWLVARDGGIFPFGNAPGHGSLGNTELREP